MKLNYILDIHEKSTWFVNTPNEISKQMPFYINEYGHYMAQTNYFTERQGQKNYLLIYTISGSGYLKYLDQSYLLEANQAVVMYCDNYHLYKTSQNGNWNFRWVHFNGASVESYFALLNQNFLNIVTINDTILFVKILDDLASCFSVNDIVSNVKSSMYMTNIMSYLIINNFTPTNNKKYMEHRNEIEKVITHIQNNYREKIDLDELAKIAYMSKHYFLRLFKKHMGVSPYEYIINFRITRAKELLRNTENSVSEICHAVGYNDCNNFIREFKKISGVTPLKYRNDHFL